MLPCVELIKWTESSSSCLGSLLPSLGFLTTKLCESVWYMSETELFAFRGCFSGRTLSARLSLPSICVFSLNLYCCLAV